MARMFVVFNDPIMWREGQLSTFLREIYLFMRVLGKFFLAVMHLLECLLHCLHDPLIQFIARQYFGEPPGFLRGAVIPITRTTKVQNTPVFGIPLSIF